MATENIEEQVAQFKIDHDETGSLPEEHVATAKKLHSIIHEARVLRASVMEEMKKVQMPNVSDIHLTPELQLGLEQMQVNFMAIMKQVTQFKIGFLIKDQVEQRMDIINGWPVKELHLSAIDQQIVDLLDQFKVIDVAQGMTQTADDIVSHVIGHHEHLFHQAVDFALFPGVISATTTAFREFEWLSNDETSLGDSFKYGVAPAALRTTLRVIGLSLDTSLGWVTGGLFTGASIALGRFLTNEGLKQELDSYVAMLNKHIQTIREQQQASLRTINDAQNEFRHEYTEEIEKCPDIGDIPVLENYIDQIRRAYTADMAQANRAVSVKKREAIAKLPKAGLFRGRNARQKAEKLYDAAERKLHSRHLGMANLFSLAADRHAEDAISHVLDTGIIDSVETRAALANLDSITEQLPGDFNNSLGAWQENCRDMWITGTENIANVTHSEHEKMAKVAQREEGYMKPIRRKIRNLQKRLRYKEPIAP